MNRTHDDSSTRSTEAIFIPPGAFIMGTDIEPFYGSALERSKHAKLDESPIHAVNLAPFYIDRFPVTNAEYKRFIRSTDYPPPAHWHGARLRHGEENLPVVGVNWHDATAYAQWAGKRLPTEAEWEKAARGVDGRIYPWGDNFEPSNSANETHSVTENTNSGLIAQLLTDHLTPVGSRPSVSSPYGTDDMAGNVWEWTADWYRPYNENRHHEREYGAKQKVLRGGSWLEVRDHTAEQYFRCANRLHAPQDYAAKNIGFRCAKDPTPEEIQRHAPQVSLRLILKYIRQQRLKNLHIVRGRAQRHSIQDFVIAAVLIGGAGYGVALTEYVLAGLTGGLIGFGFLFSANVNLWRQLKARHRLKQLRLS